MMLSWLYHLGEKLDQEWNETKGHCNQNSGGGQVCVRKRAISFVLLNRKEKEKETTLLLVSA